MDREPTHVSRHPRKANCHRSRLRSVNCSTSARAQRRWRCTCSRPHASVTLRQELAAKLDEVYAASLSNATEKLTSLIDNTLYAGSVSYRDGLSAVRCKLPRALQQTHASIGFLQKRDASTFAITVNVAPVQDPAPALQGLLERMEDKRANAEKAMFRQVVISVSGRLFGRNVGMQ